MDTNDIRNVLRASDDAEGLFIGPFPLDVFIKRFKFRSEGMYIFNTDTSDKPGQHWLSVFVSADVCEFFDSYGMPLTFYPMIEKLFRGKDMTMLTNEGVRLQGKLATTCGDYCVLFCLLRANGWSYKRFVESFMRVRDSHRRDHLVRHIIQTLPTTSPIRLENIHIQGVERLCDFDEIFY